MRELVKPSCAFCWGVLQSLLGLVDDRAQVKQMLEMSEESPDSIG